MTPVRDGLMLTFFIFSFELFDRAVKTIKNALELISEGIL
tara:strand:- start:926 stop:1045 length:120 start_codon:yes stop_codon:yes gene_type:complete